MREELLRLPSVLQRTGLSRSTWYAEVKAGRAPRPIRPLGTASLVAWIGSDIDAWIAGRIAAASPVSDADHGAVAV